MSYAPFANLLVVSATASSSNQTSYQDYNGSMSMTNHCDCENCRKSRPKAFLRISIMLGLIGATLQVSALLSKPSVDLFGAVFLLASAITAYLSWMYNNA